MTFISLLVNLQDHLPLKQGLRQVEVVTIYYDLASLQDHLPLKQGLRHLAFTTTGNELLLQDHLPLKQGLRQCLRLFLFSFLLKTSRPSSTKTRIKTISPIITLLY
mgnify:FL=1